MRKMSQINEAEEAQVKEAPEAKTDTQTKPEATETKPEAKPEGGEEKPEDKTDLVAGAQTLKQIINLPYDQFIQKLTGKTPPKEGEAIADIDPKVTKVLSLGKDDLKLEDEKVPVNDQAVIPVKNLFPTQAQIGLLDSIGFLAFVKPELTKNPLSGQANFDGERILTANSKYILDGHHRWSQTYILNPSATIPALDLSLKVSSEKEMLKVIQLAIASTYGKIAMKAANAVTDIYNDEIIKKWNAEYKVEGDTTLGLVKAILDGKCGIPKGGDAKNVETFVKIVAESKKLDGKEGVEKYLAENADALRTSTKSAAEGAPARSIMPQPGDTAKAVGKGQEKIAGIPADFVNKLSSGQLNYKPNFLNIKKESKFIKTFEQFRNK